MLKKKRYVRVIAIMLALLLALPMTLQAGYAAAEQGASTTSSKSSSSSASDIQGHWAEKDFNSWLSKGLLAPDNDGSFKPNSPITRAEFAVLVNGVFNLQDEAEIVFSDLPQTHPYYSDVMKAVAKGYLNGYDDGTARPLANVSRQEASVILYRLFQLKELVGAEQAGQSEADQRAQSEQSRLSDVPGLPSWSRSSVEAMVNAGFISGYPDGTFKPKHTMTKAEAVRLIGNISGELLVEPGTYKELSNTNAVVSSTKVFIENSKFSGNVYVTEGVAEGDVSFKDTSIGGVLHVAGGGPNSVTLDNSSIGTIVVDKKSGLVRIVFNGKTEADEILLKSSVRLVAEEGTSVGRLIIEEGLPEGATIELIGDFDTVEVRAASKPTIKIDGSIGKLEGLAANVVEEKLEEPKPSATPEPVSTPRPNPNPNPNPPTEPSPPVFRNDSVHDPSIILVDDMYYVFGSHLAAAKSPDLMQWTTFANGVNAENPLFDNVLEELAEAFEWAEIEGLWAADVIELNGKYLMYYNACKGDSPLSALGIAVSDHIEGPYVDQGIFLRSGKGTAPLGDKNYNANIHPNTIDPHVFFDNEGKLWMVYGSYSGGIFIMEMNAETGFPIAYDQSTLNSENDGYGRKLMGGNHGRIEAPYIQYDPVSEYYYLYVTFGGLDAIGGYNMRVSRSTKPEGPYLDAEGNNMLLATGVAGGGLVSNDPHIAPYGVKQLGNFEFSNLYGIANYPSYGYVSAGHNSTYYDEETGKMFNIFHSRFPSRGEQHEIRVHQMWTNEMGWPVMAPHRYSGETIEAVSEADVTGPYHFINHGKAITKDITPSSYIELLADGSIAGSVTGSWELTGERGYDVMLELLEGEQQAQYYGVLVKAWDSTRNQYVMTFTASSEKGVTVWGSQLEKFTDQELVDNVAAGLYLGDTERVYQDLPLATTGPLNSVIQWQSSNTGVVQTNGTINRPAHGEGDVEVILMAMVTKGEAVNQRTFTLTVKEQPENELEDALIAHYTFEESLAERWDASKAGVITGDRIGNTDGVITYGNGVDGRSAQFDGASGVRLPDGLIESSSYSVSLWLKPEQLNSFTTTFFGAVPEGDGYNFVSVVPQHGFWNNMVVWSLKNGAYFDAHSNTALPLNQWTQVVFTVDRSNVKVYVNGSLKSNENGFPQLFNTDIGEFALGVNYWDLPYKGLMDELRVYDVAISAEQIKAQYDQDRSNVWELRLNQTELDLIIGSTATIAATITPATANGQPLVWSSSDEAVATVENGVITAVGAGKATITVSSVNDPSKRAQAIVRVQEDAVLVESLELNVEEIQLRGGSYKPSDIVILPAAATLKALSWSIDDPTIAEIDAQTGRVTAKASGETIVTAQTTDGSSISDSYKLVVNVEGLVAYYGFEDDLSNGVNTVFGAGTVVGSRADQPGGSITYDNGVAGAAASFDGATGVRLPNGLIDGNEYTVSLWLKPEQLSQFTTAFFGARTGDDWISLVPRGHDGVNGNTMLWSRLHTVPEGVWNDANTGISIGVQQWSHIAFTVNQGEVIVYIDGVERHRSSNFNDVFTADNAVFALAVNYWDTPYRGLMDELLIYSEVLTAEEISGLATQ